MQYLLFIVYLFFALPFHLEALTLESDPSPGKSKTICLNMIVKDESPVIRRSLASVKPLIDYWVIVDTGSSDGTQQIIKDFMKDIPGELHERPWVDFATNRNEALSLARNKGDYCLFIDADEELIFSNDFKKPDMDKDCYLFKVRQKNTEFQRVFMINNNLDWQWRGVLHEELTCPEAKTAELLLGVVDMADTLDGNRSQDPNKYIKDAQTLEKALEKDPDNARYLSFLGQSYLCAQNYEMALKTYERRVALGGWDQEVFWALYSIAMLQEYLKMPQDVVINSYCKAFHYRTTRAEPLYRLSNLMLRNGNFIVAYTLAGSALSIPLPQDIVYVEQSIYNYELLFTYANAAFLLNKFNEAEKVYHLLLTKPLPQKFKEDVEKNLAVTKQRLAVNP